MKNYHMVLAYRLLLALVLSFSILWSMASPPTPLGAAPNMQDNQTIEFAEQGFSISLPTGWSSRVGNAFGSHLPPDTISLGMKPTSSDISIVSVELADDFPQDIKDFAKAVLGTYRGILPEEGLAFQPSKSRIPHSIRTTVQESSPDEKALVTAVSEFIVVQDRGYWLSTEYYSDPLTSSPLHLNGKLRVQVFEQVINSFTPLARSGTLETTLGLKELQQVDEAISALQSIGAQSAAFVWPTTGYIGWIYTPGGHNGVDIWTSTSCRETSTSSGNPVYAASDGYLDYRYKIPGGVYDGVRIDYGTVNGVHIWTHYWHLASLDPQTSEQMSFVTGNIGNVNAQTVVGYQGNLMRNGNDGAVQTTCVHLHVTVANGAADSDSIDPSPYFGAKLNSADPNHVGWHHRVEHPSSPMSLDFSTVEPGNTPVEIVVTSRGDTRDHLFQDTVVTDSQGNGSVQLSECVKPGEYYDIYAKPDNCFRQKTESPVRLEQGANVNYVAFDAPCLIDDKNDNSYRLGELRNVLSSWGSQNPGADYDGDGQEIGLDDLRYVLINWGPAEDSWADSSPLMCGPAASSTQADIGVQDANGSITLIPDTGSFNVGDTFDIQVLMDTGGHDADGVDLVVLYDSGVLAVQDAEPITDGTQISIGSMFGDTITNTVQSSHGEIRYSAQGSTFQGSGTLASITFEVTSAIPNTAVEVYYREGWTGESNIVESGTLTDVLGSANVASFQTIGSPSRPMPTVSFTPASNASVNTSMIQLEAQAIDPYNQVREVIFEVNLDGVWTTIASDTYAPYWKYLWDASSVPDGVYDLRATALLLGGEGTTVVNDNIVLDRRKRLFLPVILRYSDGSSPPGGEAIRGTVTDNGVPAAGLEILLRYDDGPTWSTYATTTTDSNGYYQFADLPDLGPDQKMYVRWDHEGQDLSRLWLWRCGYITPSNVNDPDAYRCDFDVSEVYLQSPDRWATISLPYTFTWKKRIISSDIYQFHLADIDDNDPDWWTMVLYDDSYYTLSSLPEGFVPGEEYAWWLRVYGPGGYGISYRVYEVTFSNAGTSLQGQSPPAPYLIEDDDEAGMRPQVR